jgi:hypothetical protein
VDGGLIRPLGLFVDRAIVYFRSLHSIRGIDGYHNGSWTDISSVVAVGDPA